MRKIWKQVNLGDVFASITNGINCDQKSNSGSQLVTRIETISQGVINLDRIGRADLHEKDLSKYRMLRNDILFSHINSPIHVGKTALFEIDDEVYHGVNLLRMRTIDEVNPKFLRYFLLHLYTSGFWRTVAKQSVNQASVNQKDISAVPFSYPSLEKQHEIVEKLDCAFTEIDLLEANLSLGEEKADELFQSLLSDSFGAYQANATPLQEHSIGEVCEVGDGNHSSKYPTKSEMIFSGVPFIRAQNIVNGAVDDTNILYISRQKHEALRKGHLKEGDILITNRGEIGKLAIVPLKFDGSNLNSQIAWLRCRKEVNNAYLYYFLKSEKARRIFDSGTSGSALQQLTISKLKEIKVPVVSLLDQRAIVKRLDIAFAEIESLKVQIKAEKSFAVALRQSLLANSLIQEKVA